MSKLSQELIDQAENAISSNLLVPKDSEFLPSISYKDYDSAVESWNIIRSAEPNTYIQFASNAAGMTSYGFYKATNGQIYVVEAFVQVINRVYYPTNKFDCLKDCDFGYN
jgi:hypothetical protein